MIAGRIVVRAAMAFAAACITTVPVFAGERHALIVSGASGGAPYALQYDQWRSALVETLVHGLGWPAPHVAVLGDAEADGARKATRENVRRAMAAITARATDDDLTLVVLIGHGTGVDADDARFNLVGPDLTAREWAGLVGPVRGRLVFVNAASASFPFLEAVATRGRIVIVANHSAAQQYDTVFPAHFVQALADRGADADRNGRVSVWEAFLSASAGVGRWYEQRGQLVTERALLDDTGAAVGREADGEGTDGVMARVTYLQPDPPVRDTGDPELTRLLERRARLERKLETLRAGKAQMPAGDYDAALERIVLELAQIGRRLRGRS